MSKNLPTIINKNLDYQNPKVIETLRATVAKGTNDHELQMFIAFCESTGLNPFKKEIWCIVASPDNPKYRKVQMMTGINGYLAIANTHPQMDGMEVDTKYDDTGTPIESVCKVYRKDRRIPSIGKARWTEDSKPGKSKFGGTTIWGEKPTLMLEKVAKSRALREAFSQELNGTYIPEEMGEEYFAPSANVEVKEEVYSNGHSTVNGEAVKKAFGDDDLPTEWDGIAYNVEGSQLDREEKKELYLKHKNSIKRDAKSKYWIAEREIKELEGFKV